MNYKHTYLSPLGKLLMASDGEAVTGLWLPGQRYYPEAPDYQEADLPVFRQADRWLEVYFAGKNPGEPPRLAPAGTAFRMEIWKILLTIPYGKTMTYGEIAGIMAEKMEKPRMSAQAVGGAVGHNPISIMIPCHRVVGSDGSLTGYAGGVDKKEALLKLEGVFIPVSGS